MRSSFITAIAVGFSLSVCLPAFAGETDVQQTETTVQKPKKLNRPRGAIAVLSADGPIALTAQECKGLGGKIDANINCMPQKACFTVDPAGVVNKVCLSATN